MAGPLSNSQSQAKPGFFRSVYDGAVLGDFSDNSSFTKKVSQVVVGVVPFAGQAADARDTASALREVRNGEPGGWKNLGFAAIGWIPLAGDFAKSVRKVGLKQTFASVGDAFSSMRQSWKGIRESDDFKAGTTNGGFYKPAIEVGEEELGAGTLGATNRYGDITIQPGMSDIREIAVLNHEKVHQFLSPSLTPLQKFRADVGLLGYSESHLLRRTEEGLAESYAQFKSKGFSGVREGWRFPYESDYGIDPNRVRIERNLLIGTATTAASIGYAAGESLSQPQE